MTEVLAPIWRQAAARVARQIEYGAGHYWLDLDVEGELVPPRPGQFVQILLPPVACSAFLPRPMSVAAALVRRGALRLGFLYAPVGSGTLALSRLHAGADVEILGPLGHGFPLERPGTPVLLAGGRGVAPLLFAAEALARAGRRSHFLFGARTRHHLVGIEDARRVMAKIGGKLHVGTDDGSRGFRGNVVQMLDDLAPRLAGARAKTTRGARANGEPEDAALVLHACGPHAMLKSVADWSVARDLPAYLAMESVMACGTGVCRGCPLPRSAAGRARFSADAPSLHGNREFAMCCAEGPVFEASELDWERIE